MVLVIRYSVFGEGSGSEDSSSLRSNAGEKTSGRASVGLRERVPNRLTASCSKEVSALSDYESLSVYQVAMDLSTETWGIVRTWPYFHKDTLGKQIIRAVDSVPANLAEGYGRYTFKDRTRFCYYARGSLFEYKTHLTIALQRRLIEPRQHERLLSKANKLGQLLNGFIRHLTRQSSQDRDSTRRRKAPE